MTPAHDAGDERSELLQGTLEMLVLKMLALEPMHGWGLSQRIQETSRDVILVSQGSLYPALQRMKRRGWIKSSWQTTANNRRARYYELTTAGRRQLEIEHTAWKRAYAAVNWVMQASLAGGGA
jgi:PadR family transcriptional regulator PadR